MVREGFGRRDGSQRGFKAGGQGRNRTSDCRHPEVKAKRESKKSEDYTN